jgi:hypothetical protein
MRRTAVIGAVVVVVASVLGRVLASRFSLYLEPWAVTRELHLWQLVTWIFTGASLTFIAHAALLFLALFRGVAVRFWLGPTLLSGALTAMLAWVIPAVLSCTFAGAGVGATSALWAWSRTSSGRQRWAIAALALVPALLDGVVDGRYALLPYVFVLPLATGWVRVSGRRT